MLCSSLRRGGVEGKIERKVLERYRGFMNYVARTYPLLTVWLKGLYMTIDGWRSSRDEDGWKLPHKVLEAMKAARYKEEAYRERLLDLEQGELWAHDGMFAEGAFAKNEDGVWVESSEGPVAVVIKDRLRNDLKCITKFLSRKSPPQQSIRGREKSKGVASVVYGFMDAAKYGFGDAFDQPGQDLQFNFGLWQADIATEKRSNYKELRNVVEALERFLSTRTP